MSPSDLEELLLDEPIPPLRLTLASGDQVVIRREDNPFVSGLSLVLGSHTRGQRPIEDLPIISVPNIVLIEPLKRRPQNRGRRR